MRNEAEAHAPVGGYLFRRLVAGGCIPYLRYYSKSIGKVTRAREKSLTAFCGFEPLALVGLRPKRSIHELRHWRVLQSSTWERMPAMSNR